MVKSDPSQSRHEFFGGKSRSKKSWVPRLDFGFFDPFRGEASKKKKPRKSRFSQNVKPPSKNCVFKNAVFGGVLKFEDVVQFLGFWGRYMHGLRFFLKLYYILKLFFANFFRF